MKIGDNVSFGPTINMSPAESSSGLLLKTALKTISQGAIEWQFDSYVFDDIPELLSKGVNNSEIRPDWD